MNENKKLKFKELENKMHEWNQHDHKTGRYSAGCTTCYIRKPKKEYNFAVYQ